MNPTNDEIQSMPAGEELARLLCEAAGARLMQKSAYCKGEFLIQADEFTLKRPFDKLDDAWWFVERVADRLEIDLHIMRLRYSAEVKAETYVNCKYIWATAPIGQPALALCRACVMAWARMEVK